MDENKYCTAKDKTPQPHKSRFLLQAKEQVDLPTSEPQEKP